MSEHTQQTAATGKKSFEELLNEQLDSESTFPVVYLGPHKVKRTKIPTTERMVRKFDIDNETDLKMSIMAMRAGVTIDELYRSVIWSYLKYTG